MHEFKKYKHINVQMQEKEMITWVWDLHKCKYFTIFKSKDYENYDTHGKCW